MNLSKLEVLTCIVPGTIENIHKIVREVLCYFEGHFGAMSECTLFELKVILNELVLNAVRHGNRENSCMCIKVVAGVTKTENIFVMVRDEGEGYNYRCVMKEREDVNNTYNDLLDIRETGRGLLIVKNLCDKVMFNKSGNTVMVIKKIVKD